MHLFHTAIYTFVSRKIDLLSRLCFMREMNKKHANDCINNPEFTFLCFFYAYQQLFKLVADNFN